MSVFYQEVQPRESKRCKFLATVLKEAFSNCHTFNKRKSDSVLEEDYSTSDIDDESEVIISKIRCRAMEKVKHRPSLIAESFSWELSPSTKELYMSSKQGNERDHNDDKEEERD